MYVPQYSNIYAIRKPLIVSYFTMLRGCQHREFTRNSRTRSDLRPARQAFLKRYLLIFSDRILDSSVEAGTPSWAAAPDGPETRPSVAANAVSMASFSCAADRMAMGPPPCLAEEDSSESQLGSTENRSVSQTMTDRSITFCSSRMFPGQA